MFRSHTPFRAPSAHLLRRLTRPTTRVFAVAVAMAGLGALPAAASADALVAKPAPMFRDSVGVQMHSTFTGYASDREATPVLAGLLKTLGVWHVRDSICLDTEQACVRPRNRMAALRAAAAASGMPPVDFLYIITRELETHPERAVRDADILRALVAMSRPPLAGMVAGIEETNEPDLQKTAGWPAMTSGDDRTLRTLLAQRRFGFLRSRMLLGPSIGHPVATLDLVKGGWNAAQPAYPNFHPYPPAWGGPENALDAPCSAGLTVLDCARKLAPGNYPPIATESGYSTTGGTPSANWVSEAAQGIYMPRLIMENFARGIARTYLYELIDLGPDKSSATNGFGLWRSRYTSNMQIISAGPKPAALAISRMNQRIGDAGRRPIGGLLNIDIRGEHGKPVPETTIRRQLLRRSDGTYVLALWQPKAVFSNIAFNQRSIPVPDLPVTITLPGRAGSWNATAFRPSVDGLARRFRNTNSVTTGIGADLTLVDLRASNNMTPIPGGPLIG